MHEHSNAVLHRLQAIDRQCLALDKKRAEDALGRHFAALGLPRPPVCWTRDITEGRRLISTARPTLGSQVDAWRDAELGAQLGVGRLVADWRWTDAEEVVHESTNDSARDAIRDAAWSVLESRAIRMPDSPEINLRLEFGWEHARSAALSASLAAAWRPAMKRHIPVWEPFLDACEAGLWIFWVVEHEIIAVPRPILRGLQGRLHHDFLPAAEWPSGSRWWVWHGVQVPREVIEDPGSIKLASISAEKNLEVRRILIERYGHSRFLADLGARPVSTDDFGTLYKVHLTDDEPLALVKVVNSTPEPDGSRKDYFLRVPPRMDTAREAIAWTFRLEPEAYRPVRET